VHDALVRKAQEKAVADVEAFKQQQRLAVAASVEAQRAQKERADQASTAVRARSRCRLCSRVRTVFSSCLTPQPRRCPAQAHKQPNMSAQFLDNFGRSAR